MQENDVKDTMAQEEAQATENAEVKQEATTEEAQAE